MENGNGRILVLWKTRIGEFFFFFNPRILVFWRIFFFFILESKIREFSFCGKPELENFSFFLSENSRIVENQNRRIFFFREFSCLENGWKTLCEKPELENFFFLSQNSRIVENHNRRIFIFFFFLSENSRFVENQNWRIFFLFFLSERSRIVENQNRRIFFFYRRILVL